MSPGNQATTSTGLNYLLAEDNDNMRIPFAGGGGMSKRAFLKLIASLGGTAAAFKSGLLSLGEGGTKKAVSETVKKAAGSGGEVPPYFFKLVEKIQKLGDDVTPSYAVKDRQKVTKYKDYELTEDVTTGEKTIQRMKVDDDLKYDASEYYGKPVIEETYMSYKPGKGQVDETMKGKTPPDEYIEDTSLIRTDKPAKGGIEETFDGVPDDVLKEIEAGSGNVPESFYTGPNPIKKAEGGRIGFSGGGILRAIFAKSAASKGLSVRDFIKATNYKGLPPEVRMYISPEEFAALKGGQKEMYDNFIDMAKTRLNFQKNVEGGKKTPAAPLFENLEKTMDEQSFVPKTVTDKDIAQMELMVKNRFNKGRKDNAQGGLQTNVRGIMDDILSQIIAYAPDKIDTELKAAALVQGSRNMDQEPRIPFGDGLSVDPERDSFKKISNVIGAYNRYRRGEKNPALNFNQFFELFSTENFASGGSAGQLVSNTVDGSRPGYAGDETFLVKVGDPKKLKNVIEQEFIEVTGSKNRPETYKKTGVKKLYINHKLLLETKQY